MAPDWRDRLESVLRSRNPELLAHLGPGLPAGRIRRLLQRNEVRGNVAPLMDVYAWRDGTRLTQDLVTGGKGFFPGLPHHLLDLELALAHFDHARAAAATHPEIREGVGRYFPMFWNGDIGWFATDLDPSAQNRVLVVDHSADVPFREAYGSFSDFMEDAILSIDSGRTPARLRA